MMNNNKLPNNAMPIMPGKKPIVVVAIPSVKNSSSSFCANHIMLRPPTGKNKGLFVSFLKERIKHWMDWH